MWPREAMDVEKRFVRLDSQTTQATRHQGALQSELTWALSIADRANNAVLEEHRGQWRVEGDPTEAALIVAAQI
jgi:magnesium-transporting ATPase (P-type)